LSSTEMSPIEVGCLVLVFFGCAAVYQKRNKARDHFFNFLGISARSFAHCLSKVFRRVIPHGFQTPKRSTPAHTRVR
jgi:hypothetical protein